MAGKSTRKWPSMVVGGLITLIGLLLALQGGWLAAVGGSWFYLLAGLAYLPAGLLVMTGRRSGLWLLAAIFAATLIWAAIEVDWNIYTVFTLIPRLDMAMLIAVLVMLPWVWRRLGRDRISTLLALVPGIASLVLVVIGVGVVLTIPTVGGSMPVTAHGIDAQGQAGDEPTLENADFALPDAEGVAPGDWRHYGRTLGGSRYSPLDQITPDNVGQLKEAWRYQSGDLKYASSGAPHFAAESTPLKIDDTVYTCTPNAWIVALDADSGEEKWVTKPGDVGAKYNNFVNCRGVSYFEAPEDYRAPDGSQACRTRIIAPTMGPFITAVDARTGQRCEDFGDDGFIDLRQNMGIVPPGGLVQTSPPLVMDGVVVTGGNVLDNWFVGEASGVIRGWDAVTGQERWHWDLGRDNPTAPLAEGEFFTSHTPNSWGIMTGDPKLGIVYVPTGNATPDYWGKNRRAFDEKYSGAVVALDIGDGHEHWHFQQAHTDVWDYDLPIAPSLIEWPDKNASGETGTRPALVMTNKRGQLFVLDRQTGEPLITVEEKPVDTGPESSSLKDWQSPTQPYATGMPATTPPKLKETDMWGATPFDQMWCRIRFNELYYGGDATPPTVQGSLMYPTFDGVTDWYGAALTPDGHMSLVSNYLPFVGTLIPRADADKRLGKAWDGKGTPPLFQGEGSLKPQYGLPYAIDLHPFLSPIKAPCNAPPWATLSRVNLARHRIEWTVPLGDTRKTAPFGFKHDLPLPTGIFSLGSGVNTKGGVVFITGTADQVLRAFDQQSGEELWSVELPAGAQSTPSVYRGKDGREYVVVTAGGHQPMGTQYGDYTIAWALPERVSRQP